MVENINVNERLLIKYRAVYFHFKYITKIFAILIARKSLKTSNTPSNNKCMDVMSAFVGIDGFEIHDVSDNVVFILNAIACNEANIKPCFINTKVFLDPK